jgi:hypothetical protein
MVYLKIPMELIGYFVLACLPEGMEFGAYLFWRIALAAKLPERLAPTIP